MDIHRPSLDAARAAGVRGRCIQADIMALPFADGSYDVVTALDVIEHLPKEGGLALLDELERVCRGQVVVLTPYGFMEQPPYPDQPWMEHQSGWWPRDFADRGYRTRRRRWRPLLRRHEEHAAFRWGPVGKAVGLATVPMARRVPRRPSTSWPSSRWRSDAVDRGHARLDPAYQHVQGRTAAR